MHTHGEVSYAINGYFENYARNTLKHIKNMKRIRKTDYRMPKNWGLNLILLVYTGGKVFVLG